MNKFLTALGAEQPLFLGPMAGVTDRSFRQLCHEMGAQCTCTEMVSAKALHYGNEATRRLLLRGEDDGIVGVQLFGSEPEILAEAAAQLEADFDYIDINMGCPMPKIVGNGEGSALMLDPPLAGRIVRAVADAVKKPVSVKIRKGFDETRGDAVELSRRLADSGAAWIAVHGRRRAQYYSGKADWDVIRRVREAVPVPVIGNGDIFSAADALRMREETGCDGLMIARGAQGNPWLFREIAAALRGDSLPERPSREEMAAVMRRHGAALIEEKGSRVGLQEFRKHLTWYTAGFPGASLLRREACRIQDWEAFEQWLSVFQTA